MLTACPLPSTVGKLSPQQRNELAEWINELIQQGRHLEASTLRSIYYPLV